MSEALYLLTLTEAEALADATLPFSVMDKARILLQPVTRTDAGITTPVYTPDQERAK